MGPSLTWAPSHLTARRVDAEETAGGEALAASPSMNRFRRLTAKYPRQFWLLFGGLLISSTGGSMVWPFLTILVRQRLGVPMTTEGLLLGLYFAAGLVATLLAGSLADRIGRKGVMLISLFGGAAAYLAMSQADSLSQWVILMVATGAMNPLFRVGSDAMVADLLPPDQRAGAYALLRMSNNLGVAIGPAAGGFIAAVSYDWAFACAAAASVFSCRAMNGVPATWKES